MSRLLRRTILGVAIGLTLYAIFASYIGLRELGQTLRSFAWSVLVPVLLLTLANYALRFGKWELYLRRLGIYLPKGISLSVFLSGLSMVVTPGKIGELLKAYLLHRCRGTAVTTTVPVILAERVSDLVALVLLMTCGLHIWHGAMWVALPAAAAAGGFFLVVSTPSLSRMLIKTLCRLPRLASTESQLQTLYDNTALAFGPRVSLYAVLISVFAWGAECLGLALIIRGLGVAEFSWTGAVFAYSAATVGGIPSPGGLGLTEGGLAALLSLVLKLPKAQAAAATLLIRICTLWFAVVVGGLTLILCRRLLEPHSATGNLDLDIATGNR